MPVVCSRPCIRNDVHIVRTVDIASQVNHLRTDRESLECLPASTYLELSDTAFSRIHILHRPYVRYHVAIILVTGRIIADRTVRKYVYTKSQSFGKGKHHRYVTQIEHVVARSAVPSLYALLAVHVESRKSHFEQEAAPPHGTESRRIDQIGAFEAPESNARAAHSIQCGSRPYS